MKIQVKKKLRVKYCGKMDVKTQEINFGHFNLEKVIVYLTIEIGNRLCSCLLNFYVRFLLCIITSVIFVLLKN